MQNGARVRRSPGRGPQARAGHPHPDLAIPYNSGIRTCPAWNVQLETIMVAKWGTAARPPGRGPKAGLRAPGRCGPPGTCHPEQSPGLRAMQWFLLGTLGLQGGGAVVSGRGGAPPAALPQATGGANRWSLALEGRGLLQGASPALPGPSRAEEVPGSRPRQRTGRGAQSKEPSFLFLGLACPAPCVGFRSLPAPSPGVWAREGWLN